MKVVELYPAKMTAYPGCTKNPIWRKQLRHLLSTRTPEALKVLGEADMIESHNIGDHDGESPISA